MDKLDMQSLNMTNANIEKIANLFPNVITEKENEKGEIVKAIDFDLLKQQLSTELVEDENERYTLNWPGKKASILKANTPINKTLRPIKEDSVNFDETENLYIEGDNFEVLKLLQESYLGKVKMIYIDPPYNTGKDFVYKDNFKKSKEDYEEELGIEAEETGGKLFRNTDTNGRFHSDWLSMMYERLIVARDLLKDDGVIFMSIDDNEVHNLRKIADEVFGEENFVGCLIRRTINSGKHDSKVIPAFHESLLVYSKNINFFVINQKDKSPEEIKKLYNETDEYENIRGRHYVSQLNKSSIQYSDSLNFPIKGPDGIDIWPGEGIEDKKWCFRWGKNKVEWGIKNGFITFKKDSSGKYKVYAKSYEKVDNEGKPTKRGNPYSSLEFSSKDYSNFNATPELTKILGNKFFDFPKPVIFIKELLKMTNNNNDIVLDFFSGSATTAHAIMQLNSEDGGNRKFIMVQIPEEIDEKSEAFKAGYKNICEIAKERIRRAGKKILEENKDKLAERERGTPLDTGFRVYRLADSNMKDVFYHPTKLGQQDLFDLENNIKEDRNSDDLLAQVMLDLGLTLDLPIETKKMNGNKVYFVQENLLVACFDDNVNFEIIDKIAECEPIKVVFKDSSFRDDKDRINFETRFKRLSPNTVISVI